MKIVIFEPNSDLSTNPTLINIIHRLLDDGISVDIYQPNSGSYLQLEIKEKNLRSSYYYYGRINLLKPLSLINPLIKINVLKRLLFEKELIIFAIDPGGVVEVCKYYKWIKKPFVYFSFEMFFFDELSSKWDKKLKTEEIDASQKAVLIVTQDSNRGKLLQNENGLSGQQMFYLPVAPSATNAIKKTEFLRKRFKIPKEKKIVIHAGSFSNWTYARELIESAHNWPDDFVLLIHTRSIPNKEIKQLMINSNALNIIFSNKPCNDSIFQEMIASADIGLALYNPIYSSRYTGKNIEIIGLSSGKFSYYMKCGLPTISIRQSCYEDLLNEYKFGKNIDDFQQMSAALLDIKNDYLTFSSEAKRLFKEKLNFDNYYPDLKERLIQLVKL